MLQLILTIAAIALTVALLMASINYIPWWYKSAADTEEVLRRSLVLVEQAYDVATRANNGTPPPVLGENADGGFSAAFLPVLKILPAAPANFRWVYGLNSAASMNWVCLEYTDTAGASQGAWRGASRARAVFSNSQFVMSSACGATTSSALPTEYPAPLAVTFNVAYVPGISR